MASDSGSGRPLDPHTFPTTINCIVLLSLTFSLISLLLPQPIEYVIAGAPGVNANAADVIARAAFVIAQALDVIARAADEIKPPALCHYVFFILLSPWILQRP